LIGKSFYPDAGTFSTNSCDFFDHHRNYSKGKEKKCFVEKTKEGELKNAQKIM